MSRTYIPPRSLVMEFRCCHFCNKSSRTEVTLVENFGWYLCDSDECFTNCKYSVDQYQKITKTMNTYRYNDFSKTFDTKRIFKCLRSDKSIDDGWKYISEAYIDCISYNNGEWSIILGKQTGDVKRVTFKNLDENNNDLNYDEIIAEIEEYMNSK